MAVDYGAEAEKLATVIWIGNDCGPEGSSR